MACSQFLVFVTILFGVFLFFIKPEEEIHWNWKQINLDAKKLGLGFSKDFIWGVATSSHQIEGNNTLNQWYEWEKSQKLEPSGDATDSWKRYKEDIQLMKKLGVSSYRFSIEWSKIEPSEGIFDPWAVQHYHDLIDECIKNKIDPMITLHHFTNPIWFEKQRAWENEKLIKHFVRFSEYVFKEYSKKVKFWCTINESEVIVLLGYLDGRFPPGKKLDFSSAKIVLQNLLQAHVETYHALKKLPNGKEAQIGFVKDIIQFDPYNQWNPLEWVISSSMNHILTESILKFFETGKFQFIPFLTSFENQKAKNSLDFIGLNYYTHVLPRLQFSMTEPVKEDSRPDEKITEMKYALYAEGFYRALKRLSHLRVPIIVSENGAPDSKDVLREEWIKKYIYAMQKAIFEGVNVKGFFYWSLLDNFEWAEGYKQKFGLYHVDFKTQKRTLREGSKIYVKIIEEHKKNSNL
eukprot:gene5767-9588_t